MLVEIIIEGGSYWVEASKCKGAAAARPNGSCPACHGTGIVEDTECECVTHSRAVERGRAYEHYQRDNAFPASGFEAKRAKRASINRG